MSTEKYCVEHGYFTDWKVCPNCRAAPPAPVGGVGLREAIKSLRKPKAPDGAAFAEYDKGYNKALGHVLECIAAQSAPLNDGGSEPVAPFGWASPKQGNYFTRSKSIADRIGGLIPVYAVSTPSASPAALTLADAVAHIERKAEEYANQFGYGVGGTLCFDSQVKMDHYTSLTELADELRELAAPASSESPAAPTGATLTLPEAVNQEVQLILTDPDSTLSNGAQRALRYIARVVAAQQVSPATPQPSAKALTDERRPDAAWTDLLAYVLQDDLHNRLTPRVIDIAYTAFTRALERNKDDGGPCDWFNDTRPIVKEAIAKLRKDLVEDRALLAAEQPSEDKRDAEPFRAAVEAMVDMMEAGEWAEHVASTTGNGDPLAQRLEDQITELHNRATDYDDRRDED